MHNAFSRRVTSLCHVVVAIAFFLSNASTASAQVTYEVVADLAGTGVSQPRGGVIRGADGAFFGTTFSADFGCGTVYRIAANGTFAILHNFTRNVDGCAPVGELVAGPDGNLYGTTSEGGPTTVPLTGGRGLGTVFRITPAGQFTLLHEFAYDAARGIFPEGAYPYGALALGSDGNFYGLTNYGGDPGPCGTIFKITPAGALTVLYGFGSIGSGDGCFPNSGLNRGLDGNFYGVALGNSLHGGVVFRITPGGTYTLLGAFPADPSCNCAAFGSTPLGEPVQDAQGNLYGTTQQRGPNGMSELGTVWKLSPAGEFVLLHVFPSTGVDGGHSNSGLTIGADGNLYGATYGLNGFGTVFRVTPAGVFTNLHSFQQSAAPDGRLLETSPGVFVGTTEGGGLEGRGLVFRVTLASATGTSLAASPNAPVYSQQVTLTADVAAASGSPTGQVEFFDGATALGAAALNGGVAVLTTTSLGVGVRSLSARYGGDASFLQSTSSSVSVTVSRAQTTMTLTSAPNPSARRQTVTVTATLAAVAPAGGDATGQVQLFDGKKRIGTATLQGGIALFQVSINGMGQSVLRAVYGGNANFFGTEALHTHTVAR